MKQLAITVKHISKSFGKLKAVQDLSFDVEKNSCFGLLGPNGAGKTTTMKCIYGKNHRDNPKPEQINVFGYDPGHNDLEIKYLSGIVPQEDNLDLELSVSQNLTIYSRFYGIAGKEAKQRIDYLLEFMELTEKQHAKIKELSGGMKRRLTIARALINNPKLLILDEPTTGLDPQVRHLIWDKLRTLKKEGVTILLTTHYMEEAFQVCDTILIMNNGSKVLEGNPTSLMKDNIEPYVLEIYQSEKTNIDICPDCVRKESTEGRILLYSDEFSTLEKLTENHIGGDFYLRQSNLEDLFLKSTGRKLNE